MELSPEQITEVKKQIINQINSTFPEEKKAESISRIEAMNESEIIEFIEQNNLIKNASGELASNEKCIFCSIVSGEIPSTKIAENDEAIAILEINPLSEGHTIIVPKKHENKVPEYFANEIKEKIKNSLNPKDILIEPGNITGHFITNIIPIYGDSLETERKKISIEELQKIKSKILSSKKPEKIIEEKEEIKEENLIIPKRIP